MDSAIRIKRPHLSVVSLLKSGTANCLPAVYLIRFAAFAALLFQQQRNEIMKQFFEVVKFISELFLLLSNAACFFEVTALHLKSARSTRYRVSLKPFRGALCAEP
ncbi:hypothetical protein [Bordetella sp. N]|uniref:hypothetical protein n=1 Tax=Bordetella sp. N TaxID=1746199 RepID=UPI000708DCA6|nr:hypothetical protein [Bordetella sp. N]ALM81751.1 hypothetical protein ASB57_01130 [Bordetella sp. N]